MKTKYLIAGVAAVAYLFYTIKRQKKTTVTKAEVHPNRQSVTGENHIREIIKKSKLAV